MAVSPTLIPCDPCKCYGVGGAEKWEGQGQKIIPELIPCTTSNETCCQKSKDPVHVSITSCLCSPNRIAGQPGGISPNGRLKPDVCALLGTQSCLQAVQGQIVHSPAYFMVSSSERCSGKCICVCVCVCYLFAFKV